MTNPMIAMLGSNQATGQVMAIVLRRSAPAATGAILTNHYKYVKRQYECVKHNGKWFLSKRTAISSVDRPRHPV
jgi:hypothetical protein